tara:strand:- start:386 stop:532 length:147 start_codon:yes stop_codon:yes gene_type:complete
MTPTEILAIANSVGPAGTIAAFVWVATEIKHLRKSVDKAHERIDKVSE